MAIKPFISRLIDEQKDLIDKITKCESYIKEQVNPDPDLTVQLDYMKKYLSTIYVRLSKIVLNEITE